jgi:hypothetical protein
MNKTIDVYASNRYNSGALTRIMKNKMANTVMAVVDVVDAVDACDPHLGCIKHMNNNVITSGSQCVIISHT